MDLDARNPSGPTNELPPMVGASTGTITIVQPSEDPGGRGRPQNNGNKRKRKRSDIAKVYSGSSTSRYVEEEEDPHRFEEEYGVPHPTGYADVPPGMVNIEREGGIPEDDEDDDVEVMIRRLLAAKRRRTRIGTQARSEQLKEDMEDVRNFLSLSHEDRRAYLAAFEFDDDAQNVIIGMSRLSTMVMRGFAASKLPTKKFAFINQVLNKPETIENLATIWECADIGGFAHSRYLKLASAIGHLGDAMVRSTLDLIYTADQTMQEMNQQSKPAASSLNVFTTPPPRTTTTTTTTTVSSLLQPQTPKTRTEVDRLTDVPQPQPTSVVYNIVHDSKEEEEAKKKKVVRKRKIPAESSKQQKEEASEEDAKRPRKKRRADQETEQPKVIRVVSGSNGQLDESFYIEDGDEQPSSEVDEIDARFIAATSSNEVASC